MARIRRLASLGALGALLLAPGAAHAARPRALVFFNKYCTACRVEARHVAGWAAREAHRLSIQGIGFHEDTRSSRAFARSLHWHFPVVGDPRARIAKRYGVASPTAIVILSGHRVVRRLDYAHGIARSASAPSYVPDLDLSALRGSGRYLLVRYLALTPARTRADRSFARGAAGGGTDTVAALAVMCGTPGDAPGRLAAAGIDAPVTVVTAPDCAARLDASLGGITQRGGERLFDPAGRPLASGLTIAQSIYEYRQAHGHTRPFLPSERWMTLPSTALGNATSDPSSGALDVPLPPNLRASRLGFGTSHGDVGVQSFWWLCPSCVQSRAFYDLQAWADSHPAARLVAVTCDNERQAAANWIYEHGWRFPVYIYRGPLDFATCFERLEVRPLGARSYDSQLFLRNGRRASAARSAFPGLPLDHIVVPG